MMFSSKISSNYRITNRKKNYKISLEIEAVSDHVFHPESLFVYLIQ